MTNRVILSRRNLLTLLSKLDRAKKGDDTACTIIKSFGTTDAVEVVAQEDDVVYALRDPGPVHELDRENLK